MATVEILWITAGLSCDGDSIAITAATQPSIEDLVLGNLPGIPAIKLHHPVLAYETGAAFLAPFHAAAEGKLENPFVLVVEGSMPNGPAVAEALRGRAWPGGVEVTDFGIRGMDLAFARTSGIDAAILVDAVARGGAPGTLYLIEPTPEAAPAMLETHAMDPVAVLRLAATLGVPPPYVRVIGCEPAHLDDDGDIAVGLSASVAAAVDPAAGMVGELVAALEAGSGVSCTS